MDTETTTTETVKEFNALLRGEISAVETYDQAIDKVEADGALSAELERCRMAHQYRVIRLSDAIRLRGGDPATSSGAWGAFAKLFEGGAALLGRASAIAVLERVEDHGLKEYRERLGKLDPSGRSLVVEDLLPGQSGTQGVVRRLGQQAAA